MTDTITKPTTTRRATAPGADTELLAKLARACELCDRLNRPASDFGLDDEVDIADCPTRSAWQDEEIALFQEVADIPVQSAAGALAKLRLITRDGGSWGGGVRGMVQASGDIAEGDVAAQYVADVIRFMEAQAAAVQS